MTAFPASPLPPAEFFEEFLPQRFATAELPPALCDAEFSLGVALVGEGGGEWLLQLGGGALRVERGSRNGAPVTLVQSVADWRGGLWEGRGGAFSARAASLFDPLVLIDAMKGREDRLLAPGLLDRVEGIAAHLEVRVTGVPGGDWSAGVLLGPGSLDAADARIVLTADDAEALAEGRLDPVEALMSGKLRFEGDSGLLLKLPQLFGLFG